MNTKNSTMYRIFIVVLITHVLLLTACAGQQSAQELSSLEVSTMMEYKNVINTSISEEKKYYENSLNRLSTNLNEMKENAVSENTVRQAKYYDHLWHKNAPSQHDVLKMIDSIYPDYEKIDKELDAHLKQLDDLYFSKIEKLTLQQDGINKSIEALTKLYADDELSGQANLIKDRMLDTTKTVHTLIENKKEENVNEQ